MRERGRGLSRRARSTQGELTIAQGRGQGSMNRWKKNWGIRDPSEISRGRESNRRPIIKRLLLKLGNVEPSCRNPKPGRGIPAPRWNENPRARREDLRRGQGTAASNQGLVWEGKGDRGNRGIERAGGAGSSDCAFWDGSMDTELKIISLCYLSSEKSGNEHITVRERTQAARVTQRGGH